MKLADFGISKILKTDMDVNFTNTSVTNPTGLKGWMAPEGYTSLRYNPTIDVFPLGQIFGYTFKSSGNHPFGDDRFKLLTKKDLIVNIDVQSAFNVHADLKSTQRLLHRYYPPVWVME